MKVARRMERGEKFRFQRNSRQTYFRILECVEGSPEAAETGRESHRGRKALFGLHRRQADLGDSSRHVLSGGRRMISRDRGARFPACSSEHGNYRPSSTQGGLWSPRPHRWADL